MTPVYLVAINYWSEQGDGVQILPSLKVPKYGEKLRLLYIDTDSFVYHLKTNDFYKEIVGDIERIFDTSGYFKQNSTLISIRNNKRITGFIKD